MSATGRTRAGADAPTEREENDNYPTPGWAVDRLLEEVELPIGNWMEPCAGNGAIIKRVAKHKPRVTWYATEIRGEELPGLRRIPSVQHAIQGDFLRVSERMILAGIRYDIVLTNPPFSLAEQFLDKCLLLAPIVIFLLRMPFLASAGRAVKMRANCPDEYVLPDRPQFVKGQSDNADYAWFLWRSEVGRRPYGRLRVLNTTPLLERQK